MYSKDKSIAYWLKEVDHLIEANFDRALAEFRIGRRHWQMLNVLAAGPHSEEALAESLAPFWADDDLPRREQVLTELRQLGWIEGSSGAYALTEAGRVAHGEIADLVRIARQRATAGLTEAEYSTTLHTLERMAANLHSA